jgi:hypothetical protein
MNLNPIATEALTLFWPKDLTPKSPDFELQMVLMQIFLIQTRLRDMRVRTERYARACRSLDSLHLRRRFLERRRVWR